MSALISRDPFARTEIHRRRVYGAHDNTTYGIGNCRWCGSVRSVHAAPSRKFLYQYSQESDGGRKLDIPGLFCSVGCMRTYHS